MPRSTPDIPNASMADIAFLLLVFFLVTTTVANDKGLSMTLPPPPEQQPPEDVKIPERNLFKIQINSFDAVMVEGEPWTGTPVELTRRIKEFVMNNGADPTLSDSPGDAVISYKTDRGTSHAKFIEILDAAQAAYYEIYAERAGVSVGRWREIASDTSVPGNLEIYNSSREGIPMAISIAEPTKVGGR